MSEELYRTETNPTFMQYKSQVSNEGFVKWTSPAPQTDRGKFDWYIKPMKEGLNYTMTQSQSYDINQCIYGSYYSNVISSTSYLLVNKF
jgi:hypothetical protein